MKQFLHISFTNVKDVLSCVVSIQFERKGLMETFEMCWHNEAPELVQKSGWPNLVYRL